MRAARGADRGHSRGVLADSAQGEPKGRMDDAPCHQEGQEQDDDRIGVGSAAVEVESEGLEERPDPHALQAGGAGAKTEERRVPERHDAGVAEDEIEREGEERRDRDLARELEIRRRRDERRERAQPERDLDAPPADLCLEMGVRIGDCGVHVSSPPWIRWGGAIPHPYPFSREREKGTYCSPLHCVERGWG